MSFRSIGTDQNPRFWCFALRQFVFEKLHCEHQPQQSPADGVPMTRYFFIPLLTFMGGLTACNGDKDATDTGTTSSSGEEGGESGEGG